MVKLKSKQMKFFKIFLVVFLGNSIMVEIKKVFSQWNQLKILSNKDLLQFVVNRLFRCFP